MITVFFVAVFVAWEVDGEIPDTSAPLPAANTKIFKAKANQEKLFLRHWCSHTLAQNPDTPPEELPTAPDALMDWSLKRHYNNLLQFTVAIRILSSHEISPMEVKHGCGALRRAVQTWAGMRCLLTPYFHISMHFEAQFLRFGPCPVFGAYPYERNNRTLIRFNKNGHSGGELECTMMRNWWKTTFIQDLVCSLFYYFYISPLI